MCQLCRCKPSESMVILFTLAAHASRSWCTSHWRVSGSNVNIKGIWGHSIAAESRTHSGARIPWARLLSAGTLKPQTETELFRKATQRKTCFETIVFRFADPSCQQRSRKWKKERWKIPSEPENKSKVLATFPVFIIEEARCSCFN